MRLAAISSGEHMHAHLDHLGPLCFYLDMPLISDDPLSISLCHRYYPQVKTVPFESTEIPLHFLAENFDALFSSVKMTNYRLQKLMQLLFNKNMHFVFCPHGNSDKGFIVKKMNDFQPGERTLVYGPQMKQRLKNQQITPIECGNFRYTFYQTHRAFYDEILHKEVFSKLKFDRQTILYAPTWNDLENSSSFSTVIDKILEQLSDHFNVIIKPHPFMKKSIPFFSNEKVLTLDEFPLIYPLLSKVDMYLGDFSSIGYDFLIFDRPMFFFNPHNNQNAESTFLFQCGVEIPLSAYGNLFAFVQEHSHQKHLSTIRQKMVRFAFGSVQHPTRSQVLSYFCDKNIKNNRQDCRGNSTSEH